MSNLGQPQSFKASDRPRGSDNQPRSDVWGRMGPRSAPFQGDKSSTRPPKSEAKTYTPLNAKRVQILNHMRGTASYQPPQPLRGRPRAGTKNLYCAYHQSSGHTTNHCYELKNLIEQNIQRENLVQFVAGRDTPSIPQTPSVQPQAGPSAASDQGQGPRRCVDVITGGTMKRQTRKRRRDLSGSVLAVEQTPRPENPFPGTMISFSDEDYPADVVELHKGALVI